ncbi:MAG: SCO6745 family protein [Nakamurella sp.]
MEDTAVAGRVMRAIEPLHSMIYFVPEAEAAYQQIGLKPGRMGYFASRSAAMGAVAGGVVAATFYNFAPSLVAKYIPAAWALASPTDILAARLQAVEQALTRLLGAEALAWAEFAELTGLVRLASDGCWPEGRPLYAAHADLDWPASNVLVCWQSIALLREHRGDGHIAALVNAGYSGAQALALHTLTGKGFIPAFAQKSRGWSDQEWAAAHEDLIHRGLAADGALTAKGVAARQQVEDDTDRSAIGVLRHLSSDQIDRIITLGRTFRNAANAAGAFPPNVFAAGSDRAQ